MIVNYNLILLRAFFVAHKCRVYATHVQELERAASTKELEIVAKLVASKNVSNPE